MHLRQMPCALAISQNISAAAARTEGARWWGTVFRRADATRWHRVSSLVSPSVRSSCRLSQEASKAYRALSFATWTMMWSRCLVVSESSAMKEAIYWVTPPRMERMMSCTTLGAARVLRHQWGTAARRSRCCAAGKTLRPAAAGVPT